MISLSSCASTAAISDRCLTDSPIKINDAEYNVLLKNKDVMASLIKQLHSHNASYDAMCKGE